MQKIIIINGPNLNLLGKREPHIYGNTSFETYLASIRGDFKDITLDYFQSNIEGELISKLQEVGFDESVAGILLNAGAYTHTSIAIADAVAAIAVPVIEIHISNVFAREQFRHHSYISAYAKGTIVGLGLEGYRLGIQYFKKQSI